MKRIISGLSMVALAVAVASCSGGVKGDKAETGDAQQEQLIVGEKTLAVDVASSNIEWVGSKPGGQHNGTLAVKEGSLELNEGNLVAGSFIMDMSGITVLDIDDAEMNGKLLGHLLSPDFFSVDSFPTASFVITGVEAKQAEGITHRITGNLTMKGVVRSVSFDAHVKIEGNKLVANTPQFIINRAEWNIRYGSRSFFNNLKDKFINDEMGIKINLTAGL